MSFDELSPELQEKVKACVTPEELKALAEAEGFELSDDDLQVMDGGIGFGECPANSCVAKMCGHDDCNDYRCTMYDCHEFSCISVSCKSIIYD